MSLIPLFIIVKLRLLKSKFSLTSIDKIHLKSSFFGDIKYGVDVLLYWNKSEIFSVNLLSFSTWIFMRRGCIIPRTHITQFTNKSFKIKIVQLSLSLSLCSSLLSYVFAQYFFGRYPHSMHTHMEIMCFEDIYVIMVGSILCC